MPMPKREVPRICEQCGAAFITQPAKVRYGHARFCSRACYDVWKLAPQEGRTCTRCGVYKDASEFDRNRQQPKRLRPECLECRRAAMRAYNERTRAQRRARRILRQFGLTPERYGALLAEQDGRCAICRTTEPGADFGFFPVDHDHATGAVRGLLCVTCNHGLGNFKDDPSLLRAAANYLEVAHVPPGPDVRGRSREGTGRPTHTGEQRRGSLAGD